LVACSGACYARAFFKYQDCNALYQIVKVEAPPERVEREVTCHACGAPLRVREGKYVLKYFLLRKATRRRKYIRRQPDTRAGSSLFAAARSGERS
jgi:hypothetical protein